MDKHWVVVGDETAARIFESDASFQEIALVEQVRVRGGRLSCGHTDDREVCDARPEDRARFARALASVLSDGDAGQRFDRLVVVGPRGLLGQLRSALPYETEDKIVATIHRDWSTLADGDLAARVRRQLPVDISV
jgi:protein required for attachment to host cells